MTHDATSHDRPDLVLHIGSGKTGTSTIQHFLDRNRALLADQAGVLVPRSPGARRHTRLGLSIRTDHVVTRMVPYFRQGWSSPDQLRETFARELDAEIRDARPRRLLFSDEGLYSAPPPDIDRLRSFTDRVGGGVRVVVYLRRQDDHLLSRYQEAVKTGVTGRLAQRARGGGFEDTYDYLARLHDWSTHLSPSALVVRPFEREQFRGGSLVTDFLDAAAIDVPTDVAVPASTRNKSLDAESVEFLRLLNLHLVEDQGVPRHQISHQRIARRLARHLDGPTLALPDAVLDAFFDRWVDINRTVAREFVGTDELFTAPRRARDSTTEQRLDPARLPHFLELARMPTESHDALRRIAEREAATG